MIDDKHSVLLIGGAPGAGKTSLSLALGMRLGVSSMSFDDLQAGIRGLTSPDTHPDLHRTGRGHHVRYFTDTDPSEIRLDAITENTAMWPGIERTVRRRANVGPSAVIDSWMLRPSIVNTLDVPNVHSVWIHIDEHVLEQRERENAAFLTGSNDPERMFSNFMDRSRWWNNLIVTEAEAAGATVLHQDGTVSVDTMVDRVLTQLGW